MAPVKPTVPHPNANYPGVAHEQMQKLVTEKYVAGAADPVIDAWAKIGEQFKTLATDFNILVNGSQSAWTGKAAEGVRTALGKVGTFADNTGEGFERTSKAIAEQRNAAGQAHSTMPPVVKFSPGDIFTKWATPAVIFPPAMVGAPFEMVAKHQEQQAAKAEAVQVMQTRDNTMMAAAMSMPTMESTPKVTQDPGVVTPPGHNNNSNTNLGNVNANQQFGNNSNGMPSLPPPGNGTTNAAWAAPKTSDPGLNNPNNPPGGQNRPPVGPPIGPPGGFPPGMRPPGAGQNGRPGGGGPGMGRGGPGGGGAGGAGRGMGAGGMAGVGGSGRGMGSFGPATPGGSAGVMGGPGGGAGAAGAGAGAGGRGAAGGMGAGGGAGAGQGGAGEEDKEHKSNYLVPTDEFFDDDRMVAPPVIGG
ncbi:hypothetical protein JNUCC0626_40460 [Lentzea sp. JNUCC 0626]|uniref:hypothetical protein n=1 Tax=Lentzea sp. JNUCC 0626 TaxID=3367513 RepID=UPI003748304B